MMKILQTIKTPDDFKNFSASKLNLLASEIREFLINSVAETGGHLASNLGVVELTIALHKVFSVPKDTVIWDVGHQSYVHKILTGRRDEFKNLRTFGGISGFPQTNESEYDCFNTGHSSTSISAALGFAYARDFKNEKSSVVAVIGDGSISGGLAYEGINNAGRIKTNFIVVLNDNEMSISKNVGSMSKYLNKLRTDPLYGKAKKEFENILRKIPKIGSPMAGSIQAMKDSVRKLVLSSNIFEELGFTCIGPIDGHDITQMIEVFERAKKIQGPVLLHIYTKKGKGYYHAENSPIRFHGIGKFDVLTGEQRHKSNKVSMSKAFSNKLIEIARENKKVMAITAAMPDGTGLCEFSNTFKNRFFDVGIAEQHAVTFAAGLAKAGNVPVVAIYSTFLQRAYDQILHDVALQNLHVVFAIDRSGIVGEDGETHQGIYDLSYLFHIPNISILAPSSTACLSLMLDYAINKHNYPIAIRYPKEICEIERNAEFEFGKANIVQQGADITLVSVGNMLSIAVEAAKASSKSVEIIDLLTVKPLDSETLIKSANKTKKVIVLEDNAEIGGVGSMIQNLLNISVIKLGYNDSPVPHGDLESLYKLKGIDADSVAKIINEECGI